MLKVIMATKMTLTGMTCFATSRSYWKRGKNESALISLPSSPRMKQQTTETCRKERSIRGLLGPPPPPRLAQLRTTHWYQVMKSGALTLPPPEKRVYRRRAGRVTRLRAAAPAGRRTLFRKTREMDTVK